MKLRVGAATSRSTLPPTVWIIINAKNYGVQFFDALMSQIRTVTDKPVKVSDQYALPCGPYWRMVRFSDTTQIVQHVQCAEVYRR